MVSIKPSKPVLRLRPPYDNGKVKIGLAFYPVQQGPLDADMHLLQTALLGPRSSIRTTLFERLVHRLAAFLSMSLRRHV